MRRHLVRLDQFPLKKIEMRHRMLGKRRNAVKKPQRICPAVGMGDIGHRQRGRGERSAAGQRPPLFGATGRMPGVQCP